MTACGHNTWTGNNWVDCNLQEQVLLVGPTCPELVSVAAHWYMPSLNASVSHALHKLKLSTSLTVHNLDALPCQSK